MVAGIFLTKLLLQYFDAFAGARTFSPKWIHAVTIRIIVVLAIMCLCGLKGNNGLGRIEGGVASISFGPLSASG